MSFPYDLFQQTNENEKQTKMKQFQRLRCLRCHMPGRSLTYDPSSPQRYSGPHDSIASPLLLHHPSPRAALWPAFSGQGRAGQVRSAPMRDSYITPAAVSQCSLLCRNRHARSRLDAPKAILKCLEALPPPLHHQCRAGVSGQSRRHAGSSAAISARQGEPARD